MSDEVQSAAGQQPQLEASALDSIMEDMELASAPSPSVAARIEQWYRDLRESAWNWLKRVTGGEEGPLGALEKGLSRLWREGFGVEGNEAVGHALEWGSLVVLVVALVWLGRRLLRAYMPARRRREVLSYFGDASLAQPLEALPREKWVPALFTHVCIELVEAGRLTLRPSNTNRTLAANAQLPASLADQLRRLAVAADRVQFGSWQPGADELQSLLQLRRSLRSQLAELPQ